METGPHQILGQVITDFNQKMLITCIVNNIHLSPLHFIHVIHRHVRVPGNTTYPT